VLLSTAFHAALLSIVLTPIRPAHFASVPRALGESVQYLSLAVSNSQRDRAAPPHRRSRVVSRSPNFAAFDFSFASNVVSSMPVLPEPDVPRMADSLWGDAPGNSPFATANGTPADSGIGFGGGLDSVAYIAANVDRSAASTGTNPKPAYPAELLYRMIEASFSVYFVVDTTGRIDSTTIQIPPSVDRRFAKAVTDVLVRWRFFPAEIRGRRVRQFMEQPFEFRIVSGQYT
jgi:TonB family protein